MKKQVLSLLLILLVGHSAFAQVVLQSYPFGHFHDQVLSIDTDPLGNIYMGGSFQNPEDLMLKKDAAGNTLWEAEEAAGSNGRIMDISTDLAGNCYVLGYYNSQLELIGGPVFTGNGFFIAKYNATGALQWCKKIDGNGSYSNSYYSKNSFIDSDAAGNLIVAGFNDSYTPHSITFGTTTLTTKGFVARLDAAGNALWATGVQGSIKGMAVAPTGEITIAGNLDGQLSIGSATFSGPASGSFVAKLDQAGAVLWQNLHAEGSVTGVATNAAGLVFVTGEYSGSPNFNGTILPQPLPNGGVDGKNVFLLKFSAAGTQLWAKHIANIADNAGIVGYIVSRTLEADNDGNLYVGCNFNGSFSVQGNAFNSPAFFDPDETDAFLVSFDPAGEYQWGLVADDTTGNSTGEIAADIALGPNDHLYFLALQPDVYGSTYPLQMQFGNYTSVEMGSFIWQLRAGAINQVKGNIFFDHNSNGIKDNTDNNASGVIAQAQASGLAYTNPNHNGQYIYYVDSGSYTISLASVPLYYTSVPVSYSGSFASVGNIDSARHFALQPVPGMQDLQVMIHNGWYPRPGFGYPLQVTYKNVGTVAMSGSVQLTLDPLLVFLNSVPAQTSITGNTLTWDFVNLQPTQSVTILLSTTVPATAILGDTITQTATITPLAGDLTPSDNSSSLSRIVISSFDPNDKRVTLTSLTPAQVQSEEWLEYTIRFQNTGTDTAFTVLIADTLSSMLNVPTIELLASSHPNTWSVKGSGILEWHFDNILLPDSNTNEPASHGFIKYRIKPKTDLVLGDVIENTAYIYFDFNEAIVTNTATTEIRLVASRPESDRNPLHIYPNPSKGQFTLQCSNIWASQVQAELRNVLGQTVWQQILPVENGELQQVVRTNGLSKGVYYLQLRTEQGSKVQKVVLE